MPIRGNSGHVAREGRRRAITIACWSLLLSGTIHTSIRAQEQPQAPVERPHRFVIQVAGGGSLSFAPEQTVPEDAKESHFGLGFTGRLLWRPGYLLGIGVQSGFTRVSSMKTSVSEHQLHLSVVPAMIVFAMETGGFDASIATGWQRYIVSSQERPISSAWEMSYHIAAGYTFFTFGGLGIGAEASYASLLERETAIAALELRLGYTVEY